MLVDFIGRKLAEMPESEVEKAAKLQTIREAVTKAEPAQRNRALVQLFDEFPEECLSGQHFVAYGVEVDVQQVPTYDYQDDKKLAALMQSLRYWKEQQAKAEKKVKTYQEYLIASGKARLEHVSYRLRIHRK